VELFLGVLYHVEDPILALKRLAAVIGELLVVRDGHGLRLDHTACSGVLSRQRARWGRINCGNGMFHTSGPSAVAGYPAISVPAGQVSGLQVGLSFLGPAWSEPALIGLAYVFEQASQALTWPSLRGTAGAGVRATVPASGERSDSLRVWTPGVA
jgi:Amidase